MNIYIFKLKHFNHNLPITYISIVDFFPTWTLHPRLRELLRMYCTNFASISGLMSAVKVGILFIMISIFVHANCVVANADFDTSISSSIPILNTGTIEETTVTYSNLGEGIDEENLKYPTTPKPARSGSNSAEQIKTNRKKVEVLSTDCSTKRSQILLKYQIPNGNKNQRASNESHSSDNHQRLVVRKRNSVSPNSHNETSSAVAGNIDLNEHVPQCTQSGRYEPIQCYSKMNYCWCVNKYGQAIKNSAAKSGEQPSCDQSTYESESIDSLVVTGVSTHRIKSLLRGPLSSGGHSDRHGLDSDLESESYDQDGNLQGADQEDKRRISASQELHLFLLPNECTISRNNARERAMRHIDESIWIPECDITNQNLYALKQCHRSRICWCVNQVTGFPLRTKEPLSAQPNINCTEVTRLVDGSQTLIRSNKPHSYYRGFSESCDAFERAEFLQFIITQFRQQISDHLKIYPSSKPPDGTGTRNPFRLNEAKVSLWKFELLDLDHEKTLNDREWSKFKLHFKLVDKPDDALRATNQQSSINPSMKPLIILRSQRRCWRDFLECCGKGQLLLNESIQLTKWLSCAEIPSDAHPLLSDRVRGSPTNHGLDFSPARSEEAAERRKHKKNPLSSMLKPD